MIKTLSIRELESKATNIYEAVILLAKRARQINAEQKQLIQRERGYEDDEYEIFGDEDIPAEVNEDYLQLPKPSGLALEEYVEGNLEAVYPEAEQDEDSEEPES